MDTTEGTMVLACGGYRSGSTLQYNLAGEYAERSGLGRRIGFVEPEQAEVLPHVWSFVAAMGTAVAKCHLAPGVDPRSAVWDELLGRGRVCALYTVRDWRDVVHSWTRKFGQSVEEVFDHPRWGLNLASMDAWLARGAHVVRYEDLTADPAGTLAQMLAWAGLTPDDDGVDAAVAAAARCRLPVQDADPRTLLHHDHVGDPAGGAWTCWTPAQEAVVRRHIDPLMERFGYSW